MESRWSTKYEVQHKTDKALNLDIRYKESMRKKIAVIGGGCCGLMCVAMLKEEGLEPVCFEKTDKPGGTWCYREESEDGVGSIMPTTIINHSKEMGAFSTFPPDKEYNNYMRHNEAYKYYMEFFNKHNCLKHVHFNHETIAVERSADYNTTGRWMITVRNRLNRDVMTNIFDGVMVCVGHINRPKMPIYPGLEEFKGKVMHTHSLKGVSEFKGKTVVVVGIGCSALDAAVEISHVAKQVYLSTKTGAYILSRVGPKGYPMDYILLRRLLTIGLKFRSRNQCSKWLEKRFVDPIFHHKMYNIPPKYHMLEKDPIINDHIASKLLSGSIVQKPDIAHFSENAVLFKGDTHLTEIDAVIMATGYTWNFPFLEDGVNIQQNGRINLYKCMYPPHLKHPTLAIMGFVLVFGPGLPIGEIQARWATQVFLGNKSLPSQKKMEKDIIKRHERNLKAYAPNDKISIRIDYIDYMDEIATLLGVKPNFLKLFFTDIKLYHKLIFGPSLSYQYRLKGVNKWEGARDAIINSKKRLKYPLLRNRVENEVHHNLGFS